MTVMGWLRRRVGHAADVTAANTGPGHDYRPTPFRCGSCDRKLDFYRRTTGVHVGIYVHADDHQFQCCPDDRQSTDTNFAPLR